MTPRLIGMIGGALAVLAFVLLAFHWKHTMTERGEKLAAICTVTRQASGQPKLACGQVAVQIEELGRSVATLKGSIGRQNSAVTTLGDTTKRQQAESAKASQVAQERAREAEATSTRLDASSRAGEAQAKPCEPSKALKEAWK